MRISILCAVLALSTIAPAYAADRADLDGTQIFGSRELPKVLYIVPWKQPVPGDLVGRPASSLLDEVLAPVDRDVFQREVSYHALTQGAFRPTAGTTDKAPVGLK